MNEFTVHYSEDGVPTYYLDGVPLPEKKIDECYAEFGQPMHDESE